MFSEVNISDPTSTNDIAELFYEYMNEYNELAKIDQELVDVYSPDYKLKHSVESNYDIYALIDEKSKINYISHSYISLLYIGVQEYNNTVSNDHDTPISVNWNIIKL